jgi:ribonuclease PH
MQSEVSKVNGAFKRSGNRAYNELRPIQFRPGIAPYAGGSVISQFGNTQVICAATIEQKVPAWMTQQGVTGGWITAEYSMLPYSTLDRKNRAASMGKVDGRSIEIQRLIGRAIRAVVDLQKMHGWTLWIDCDVLQADGGTRTAAISGAYVAAKLAIHKAIKEGKMKHDPFRESVSAVSVGIVHGLPMLDLDYIEDKDANVDSNIVITASGQFVEIQTAGEESIFTETQLAQMISLAKEGAHQVTKIQNQVIESAILSLS